MVHGSFEILEEQCPSMEDFQSVVDAFFSRYFETELHDSFRGSEQDFFDSFGGICSIIFVYEIIKLFRYRVCTAWKTFLSGHHDRHPTTQRGNTNGCKDTVVAWKKLGMVRCWSTTSIGPCSIHYTNECRQGSSFHWYTWASSNTSLDFPSWFWSEEIQLRSTRIYRFRQAECFKVRDYRE